MNDFGNEAYTKLVPSENFRIGMHYPAIDAALGDVRGQHILDTGCGEGSLARQLAAKGASIVGYDEERDSIIEARQQTADTLTIEYHVATHKEFSHPTRFNNAVSVMFLPYADTTEVLMEMFHSTCNHLMNGGKYTSVIFNPEFSAFGKDLGSRKFTKLDGNKVRVDFIDPSQQKIVFTSFLHQYTTDQYMQGVKKGGMKPEALKPLFATREAIERLGESFWKACHETQPYALLEAQKNAPSPNGMRPLERMFRSRKVHIGEGNVIEQQAIIQAGIVLHESSGTLDSQEFQQQLNALMARFAAISSESTAE